MASNDEPPEILGQEHEYIVDEDTNLVTYDYPEFNLLSRLVGYKCESASVEDVLSEFHTLTNQILTESLAQPEYQDPALDRTDRSPIGGHEWHTTLAVLLLAARTLPTAQGPLVSFLSTLCRTEVKDPRTGKMIAAVERADKPDEKQYTWTDLPSFDYSLSEHIYGYDPYDDAGNSPQTRQQWVNLEAFVARLTAAADVDFSDLSRDSRRSPIELPYFCYRAFRYASEPSPLYHLPKEDGEEEEEEEEEEDEDEDVDYASMPTPEPVGWRMPTETCVRGFCMWLIYAADRLWEYVESGRPLPTWCDECGPDGVFATREIWDHWVKALQDARGLVKEEETKAAMEEAIKNALRVQSSAECFEGEE